MVADVLVGGGGGGGGGVCVCVCVCVFCVCVCVWGGGGGGLWGEEVGCLVAWLLNVPSNMLVYLRGRICSDNFTCCHAEIEVADQTSYLTQSQYTDTKAGPVPALTLQCQVPGRVATGVPFFNLLV